MKSIVKHSGVWFAVLMIALGALIPASAQAAVAGDGSIVVMINVDGLAGFYFDDPKAEMPNIRALAKEGAHASSMKATTPTVTWPNHTTLVTGVHPAKHGVVGNNFYDRAAEKSVVLIWDPVLDKDQIVRVPTIYDAAKAKGLTCASVQWPATRNAKSLDWVIPEVMIPELVRKYATPSVLAMCKEAGFEMDLADPKEPTRVLYEGLDERSTKALNLILQKHRPNLALFHLLNVDHVEHAKGPSTPEAYAAIKEADAQVGEVWEELKRDFPGKATLFIVSDHGFSPINQVVLPNVVLRDANLVEVKGPRIVSGSVRVVVQGGAAMVYVTDEANRQSVVDRVTKAFTGVKGVSKVIGPDQLKDYGVGDYKDDPHAPDMVLFADYGYAFGDTASGAVTHVDKTERSGTHGHDPNLPQLHASFVAWGAGIRAGAKLGEIANVDVTPTIAHLLGLEMSNLDGKVLTEALEK